MALPWAYIVLTLSGLKVMPRLHDFKSKCHLASAVPLTMNSKFESALVKSCHHITQLKSALGWNNRVGNEQAADDPGDRFEYFEFGDPPGLDAACL